jgi:hypothetical protein
MNDDDFEQELRAARLAVPAPGLDRRVNALFAEPVAAGPSDLVRWLIMLGLPAAGLTAALVLFTARPEPPALPRPAQRIVLRIEPQGMMRDWLSRPPAASQAAPVMIVTVK